MTDEQRPPASGSRAVSPGPSRQPRDRPGAARLPLLLRHSRHLVTVRATVDLGTLPLNHSARPQGRRKPPRHLRGGTARGRPLARRDPRTFPGARPERRRSAPPRRPRRPSQRELRPEPGQLRPRAARCRQLATGRLRRRECRNRLGGAARLRPAQGTVEVELSDDTTGNVVAAGASLRVPRQQRRRRHDRQRRTVSARSSGGEGGIRTLGPGHPGQLLSRQPCSTTPAPLPDRGVYQRVAPRRTPTGRLAFSVGHRASTTRWATRNSEDPRSPYVRKFNNQNVVQADRRAALEAVRKRTVELRD